MSNIIRTALPLSAENMVQFFKDKKGTEFIVNYNSSVAALRTPAAVLTYIANLKLTVLDLSDCTVTPDLLHTYATMRDKCDIPLLAAILGNVLYFCKYGEILYADAVAAFPLESIVEYVSKYRHAVIIQSAFLNSLPLFMMTTQGSSADSSRIDHPLVTTVDDAVHPEITTNLFNLFSLDHFLLNYLEEQTPIAQQIYFSPHFDKNMYQGNSLFGWFAVPENTYFVLSMHVFDSTGTAASRVELAAMYQDLLLGTGNVEAAAELAGAVSSAGGIEQFVGSTRKEMSEMSKKRRKDKKRAIQHQ